MLTPEDPRLLDAARAGDRPAFEALVAPLLLRDVYDVSNEDGAYAVGTSVAAFKHRVHDGRRTMQTIFERRCALVSKTGACWQCKELAGFFRGEEERDRQTGALPLRHSADYETRLHVVRKHDSTTGVGRDLHAFLARQLRRANDYD